MQPHGHNKPKFVQNYKKNLVWANFFDAVAGLAVASRLRVGKT